MKICLIMPISINIENTELFKKGNLENKKIRIQQIYTGLKKLFEYENIILDNNIDIIITDNTTSQNLPDELIQILPQYVKIINSNNNNYDQYNKGAGLIESWMYLKEEIKNYDYIIHFEPRQVIINFDFINLFLKNKTNLFTYGTGNKHFNTGLFCIESEILLNYINNTTPNYLTKNKISIEYSLYNFFEINKYSYKCESKMNLVWFDTHANCIRNM